ncbi:hypothetical protein CYY_006538 [Polysphondylium violaceum]|uniref:Right handed beta helix domain-containing protein n=1 Tax=Polysphondylium violaceum TaxID=133409 RepID=A0A8J4PSH1_9MYCE|nr:hypothetical protein CYY_006538 [Polysphondylium violaceum]
MAAFSVVGSNVVFRNLLLTDSHADYAPIRTSSSNVSILKSTFTYNSGIQAGVLYIFQDTSMSSSILVDGSKFTHNRTPGQGGAIYHFHQSETKDNNIIQNSIFDSNSASGEGFDIDYTIFSNGTGGALSLYGGSMSIRKCVFDSNIALNAGGAIFSQGTKVYIDHSSFSDNISHEGGAIYSIASWYNLTDSPHNDNQGSNGSTFLCRNSTVDIQAVDTITNNGYYCPVQDCIFSTTPSHNFICPPQISSGYKNNTPFSTISFYVIGLSFFLLSLLF